MIDEWINLYLLATVELRYRPYHKTLLKASAFVIWISVRLFETDRIICKYIHIILFAGSLHHYQRVPPQAELVCWFIAPLPEGSTLSGTWCSGLPMYYVSVFNIFRFQLLFTFRSFVSIYFLSLYYLHKWIILSFFFLIKLFWPFVDNVFLYLFISFTKHA